VVPLARGRGRDAVDAPERSAQLNHEASERLLAQRQPQSVLNTVLAYWSLRAAQDTTAIQTQSLQFQQQLVTIPPARVPAPGSRAAQRVARWRVVLSFVIGSAADETDLERGLLAANAIRASGGAAPIRTRVVNAADDTDDYWRNLIAAEPEPFTIVHLRGP